MGGAIMNEFYVAGARVGGEVCWKRHPAGFQANKPGRIWSRVYALNPIGSFRDQADANNAGIAASPSSITKLDEVKMRQPERRIDDTSLPGKMEKP
jgi:hypothetical protein